ncbi:PREDICTED: metalloendoproteinase 1-like [Erythranthe guttata]|uniref:metalloendoproteinase 1-like n=1 Tax=Erythranthe guttata TaxID=4155 RepID=UPI00064D835E|nr:PREDICTED: metalloendoproteinase 1-like [Erythranthe guttata]|eukprot:XP_012846816.1 PREDICTED: metalloendoproteinase 1-like [Erythranthe guttata]
MRKGDNVNGVYELKKYLSYLGYLNDNRHSNDQNQEHKNIFDDSLEIALRRYQEFYGLKTTGFLDASTITNMLQPRCGVPDLFTNPNKNPPFHTISHYSLLPGNPKWYWKNLSYSFDRNVNRAARVPLQRAFKEWESVTPFKFYYIKNISLADIQISFERGDHGDGYPFRGTIDVVAHTFPPPDGRVHFDVHQNWSLAR